MKTAIAAILALSVAAPAFAASDVAKKFALYNDSAAERTIGESSVGDTQAALDHIAASKDSSAERQNIVIDGDAQVSQSVKKFFALTNDSPAENNI